MMKSTGNDFFKNIFPQKITHQIFLILIFLVVIPLIFLGFLIIKTSQDAIKTSVWRDQRELAVHLADKVESFIQAPQQTLSMAAAVLGELGDDAWKQETVLVEIALRDPVFGRISTVDSKGQEVATSELGTPLRSWVNEPSFHTAMKGQAYQSEIHISETFLPEMTYAIPIVSMGQVRSVLIAEVKLKGIWDLVDTMTVGRTGKVAIIDREGRLLADIDKKKILKNNPWLNEGRIQQILSGTPGNFETLESTVKEPVLVSYAPVRRMAWGILVTQSLREAYAYSTAMKIHSMAIILFVVVAVIFISLVLSQMMSRPVDKLIEAMEHVAQKNFDFRLKPTTKDEFGRLFKSFNTMMVKLKEAERLEKLSTIGKAATTIAHELKNSLVLVNTYIGLLPERHHDKKFIEDFAKTVPQEIEAGRTMLQNMMDYSKIYQFKMGDVQVNHVVEHIHPVMEERAQQKNIRLTTALATALPLIRGDAERLRYVLLNILTNSLEATPSGGKIFVVTKFLEYVKELKCPGILLHIQDTGSGFSTEQIENIFEPFRTTKEKGLGLGMVISKEIVEHHGGLIMVQNHSEGGACVMVMLPVKGEK